VTLADQSLVYDVADRHVETNLADGTSIRYTRDASDRIVERRVSKANTPDVVTRFGFGGEGDSPDLVLDGDGAVIERTLPLPGGVLASFRPDGSETWSFPNLHGDIVVTTDGAGAFADKIESFSGYQMERLVVAIAKDAELWSRSVVRDSESEAMHLVFRDAASATAVADAAWAILQDADRLGAFLSPTKRT
ncbi:hypothetical protein ELQ90_14490, partial [Labedella phragmitis]